MSTSHGGRGGPGGRQIAPWKSLGKPRQRAQKQKIMNTVATKCIITHDALKRNGRHRANRQILEPSLHKGICTIAIGGLRAHLSASRRQTGCTSQLRVEAHTRWFQISAAGSQFKSTAKRKHITTARVEADTRAILQTRRADGYTSPLRDRCQQSSKDVRPVADGVELVRNVSGCSLNPMLEVSRKQYAKKERNEMRLVT